ncbi:zinc finger SWIM domain-containing protein 1-like [Rhinoraja longicauda]
MSQVAGFRVGAEFSSYSELHREYRRYQRDSSVQMWTRHSRTIKAQRRRAPKRPMNDALNFAEIDYACIHGGKLFKTKGSGKRTIQRTNKMKCPCVIKVRLSADGNKFVVKEMNESHNHTVPQEEEERLRHQRHFVTALRVDPTSIVSLRSNGAGVQVQLGEVAGKVLADEDAHSPTRKEKWDEFKTNKTDLEMMVPTLAAVKDGTVVVVVNKANVLQAIYYQDGRMKQTFERFPEVLLVGATYSWAGLWLPTYLLLAIDGNGESELACLWFLQSEERETVRQLLRIFRQKNPAAEGTRAVVVGGQACDGELVTDVLPHCKPLACLAHTLSVFQDHVTAEKLHVTAGQQSQLLQILHSMCYATSTEDYDLLYRQLLDSNAESAVDYFHKTWHGSRRQWVEGFKHENESYLTSTLQRVQVMSQRLAAAVEDFSNVTSFTRDLLKAVDTVRAECDQRVLQSEPPAGPEDNSTECSYRALLTDFAFRRVRTELQEAESVSFLSVEAERAWPVCRRRALVTDQASCQCAFRTSMRLPCRHVLALRRLLGSDLFEPSLCAARWTQEHFLGGQLPPASPRERAKVQQERYRQALKVARKLSSLAARCPAEDFGRCLAVMTAVTDIWARGGQVQVTETNVTGATEQESSSPATEAS